MPVNSDTLQDKDKTMNKEELQDYIARLQADSDRLNERYGTGVRPSWLSTDLALNWAGIESAKKKIELLDAESPCDDWAGGFGKGEI